jgi:ribonuclease HI
LDELEKVTIYTDGACKGNPGPGGYAAILSTWVGDEQYALEVSGGSPTTTNNRMELMALVVALECLKRPCSVTINSDSRYVVNPIANGWLMEWAKNDFMTDGGELRKNVDLWKRVLKMMDVHRISAYWVKGHDGHTWNERCDELADEAASGRYVRSYVLR